MRKLTVGVAFIATLAAWSLVAPPSQGSTPAGVFIDPVSGPVEEGQPSRHKVSVGFCRPGEHIVVSFYPLPPDAGSSAVPNVDYVDTPQSVTFDQSNAGGVILEIPTIEDDEDEWFEGVGIKAVAESGACGVASAGQLFTSSILIKDDDEATADAPSLAISDVKMKEGNSGEQDCTFELRLSRPAGTDAKVLYVIQSGSATIEQDFERPAPGWLIVEFAPGSTTQTIAVPVFGDTVNEPGRKESFSLDITQDFRVRTPDRTATCTIKEERKG